MESWFQQSTDRKSHTANQIVMPTMMSHDHERSRSWPKYIWPLISQNPLEIECRLKWSTYREILYTLRCFIHRWSAPVHQNILTRIFWCTGALHRWIKQRTNSELNGHMTLRARGQGHDPDTFEGLYFDNRTIGSNGTDATFHRTYSCSLYTSKANIITTIT